MDLTMPMRCPKGHLSTDAEYCSECGAKMPAAASGLDAASVAGVSAPASNGSGDSDKICPDCGTPRANPTAVFCEVCRYNFVTRTSWATPKVSSPPLAPSVTPPVSVQDSVPVMVDALVAPSVVPTTSAPPAAPIPAAVALNVMPDTSGSVAVSLPDANNANKAQDHPLPLAASNGDKGSDQNDQNNGNNGSANGLTQAPITRWEIVVAVDPSLYTDPDPQIPCPVGEPERVYSLDFAENLIGRRSEKRDIHPEINLNDACVSHRHAKIQRQPDGAFALLDVGSTNGTRLNGVEIQPAVRTPLHDGDQITLGCWTRISVRGLRG